ncbi:MAG: ATP-binding protein [Bacteroidales bacterium]
MKVPKNPFLLAGFISREYFCDRQKELSWLRDNLNNERNVVLYSWRRLGKTSLIRCLFHMLEERKDTETLHVDLMSTRTINEAIHKIARSVHEKYGKTSSADSMEKLLARLGLSVSFDPVSGIPRLELGLRENLPAEASLAALGEFLSSRKKNVIIALDEFQQINQFTDVNAESLFREWMQSFPALRMIFSGSHRNMMLSMFSQQNRPFYNSTQLLELKPIELETYREFISHHFKRNKMIIEPEQINEIYQWSRAQTYTIQLICNKLYGLNKKITLHDLQKSYAEILEQQKPFFFNYSKLLTNTQWEVLRAIAISEPVESPHSMEFIRKHQLGAASTVASALSSLIDKEMVIEYEGRYLLHDVVLARWLQQI